MACCASWERRCWQAQRRCESAVQCIAALVRVPALHAVTSDMQLVISLAQLSRLPQQDTGSAQQQ